MTSLKTLIISGLIALSSLTAYGQVPQSTTSNKSWAYEKLGTINTNKSNIQSDKVKVPVAVFDINFDGLKGKNIGKTAPTPLKSIKRPSPFMSHGKYVSEIILNICDNAEIIVCPHVANSNSLTGSDFVKKNAENFIVNKYGQEAADEAFGYSVEASQAVQFSRNVDFAIQNKAKVINFSAGILPFDDNKVIKAIYKDALNKAFDNDISIVSSAGNDTINLNEKYRKNLYLSDLDERVISVSSIDINQNLSSFSNYGKEIDIAAYGEDVYADPKNHHSKPISGTSFSAPMVSGALAEIAARNPTWTREQREAYLFNELTIDIGAPGKDDYFGYGVLNLSPLKQEKTIGPNPAPKKGSIRINLHNIKNNHSSIPFLPIDKEID